MSTKTRQQFIGMAYDELFGGGGRDREAELVEAMDDRFDGLMDELSARGIVSVADPEAIPAEWCGPLSVLLANECARPIGQKQPMPLQMKNEIEDRLQVMVQRVGLENLKLKVDPAITGRGYGLSLARWTRGG